MKNIIIVIVIINCHTTAINHTNATTTTALILMSTFYLQTYIHTDTLAAVTIVQFSALMAYLSVSLHGRP